MKFQADILNNPMNISAVDPHGLTLNGQYWNQALILGSKIKPQPWPEGQIDFNTAASSLTRFVQRHTDPLHNTIILLGTGLHQIFPDKSIRKQWAINGLTVEVMNTPAACRTFNLLLSEGRNVIAALTFSTFI